jgi:hypothetical protein
LKPEGGEEGESVNENGDESGLRVDTASPSSTNLVAVRVNRNGGKMGEKAQVLATHDRRRQLDRACPKRVCIFKRTENRR